MKKIAFSYMVVAIFLLSNLCICFAMNVPKDIVLVIDNSGSMKKGDPQFMTKDAIIQFVKKLPTDSGDIQVAVLIFDHRVNLAVPLTIVSESTKKDILASLDNIDYRGRLTDIPAAMERAIYELNTKGQEESQKVIIFITDGIVDTGDKLRDIDKTRWLRENLAEDAAWNGIKIYGIAFTDSADFELIQSLAQKTKGLYFRAFLPTEIPGVFSRIQQHIVRLKSEFAEPDDTPPITVPPVESEEPYKNQIEKAPIYVTEAPAPTPPPPVKSKKFTLPIIVLTALAVLLGTVLALLIRSRRKPRIPAQLSEDYELFGVGGEYLPEALLKDVSGITNKSIFKLGKKVTKIGRVDRINHIVINQKTVSRQHAIIEYKNYSFWVIDQNSANGTFLNGNKVADQMQLNHGDKITFDVFEFEFVLPGMECDKTFVDKTVFRNVNDLNGV